MRRSLAVAAALVFFAAALHAAPEEISGNDPSESIEAISGLPVELGAQSALPDLDQTAAASETDLNAASLENLPRAAPAAAKPTKPAALPRSRSQAKTSAAQVEEIAPAAQQRAVPLATQESGSADRAQVEAFAGPASAPEPVRHFAAAELKSMAAGIESGKPDEENSALALYDGPGADAAAADEPAATEVLDVYFSGQSKKALLKSSVFSSIRLMDTPGRQWHWSKFDKGQKISVRSGNHAMFVSEVESAATKTIGKMVKDDFAGFYSPEYMRHHGVADLRKRLMVDLASKGKNAKPVELQSSVRIVRFIPFKEASKTIEENKGQASFGQIVERRSYEIPSGLAMTTKFLPKAVVLDLGLFPNGLPPELVEDINKLSNAGVYFILTTNKPLSGPDSAESLLTKQLSQKQNDKLHRYKIITLADGGNVLASYEGKFAKPMPMPRFDGGQMEIMALAAHEQGIFKIEIDRSDAFAVPVPKNENPDAFAARYETSLKRLGLSDARYQMRVMMGRSGPLVVMRPLDIGSAVPILLSRLRDYQQLYLAPSDLMVISQDPKLLAATKGAIHPAVMAPSLQGADIADMAFASMMGEYRVNQPGDLAVSASMVSSFLQKREYDGGRRETAEMFLGHVIHSAFNWAVWRYRQDGVFPAEEAVMEHAEDIWNNAGKMLGMHAGHENIDRLHQMYADTADILKKYPIVLGTELPNVFKVQRYKGSTPQYRDFFRLVYDFAAARETENGFEVVIVDFKSGKAPTNQKLDKDIQAQLYEWVAAQAWDQISKTYGSSEGMKPVSNIAVRFIYPRAGSKEPSFDENGHIKFEKRMRSILRRIRKSWGIALPGTKAPKKTNRKT